MDNTSVKNNIRQARKGLHLTQKELADKLGISRTAYRNLEQGETRIICDHLPKIAELSGKSPEELVLGYRPIDAENSMLQDSETYQNKLANLSSDYEERINNLRKELGDKNELIAALKTSVDSLQETIRIMKGNN